MTCRTLNRNRHTGLHPEDYVIELGAEHDLLKRAEEGDRLALWARAVFPGWENRVHKAGIQIRCFDDLLLSNALPLSENEKALRVNSHISGELFVGPLTLRARQGWWEIFARLRSQYNRGGVLGLA